MFFVCALIFLGALFTGVGCSSSEETGAARTAGTPEQEGPIVPEPPADSLEMAARAGAGSSARDSQIGDPSVRRGRDTVRVSPQRVSRATGQRKPLIKPPDAMYTVQVGAFRKASNALALQKLLKRNHGDQPVFNMFMQAAGMYHVTIGKFETIREAYNYRKQLLKDDPKRFAECWVNYIERSR